MQDSNQSGYYPAKRENQMLNLNFMGDHVAGGGMPP